MKRDKKRDKPEKRPVPPVDPEKFRFLFHLAGAVGDGRDPQAKFDPQPVSIEGEVFSLADNPLNRAMFAVMDHCEESERIPVSMRIMALMQLIPDLKGTPLVRNTRGFLEMHDCAVERAATCPLSLGQGFELDEFLKPFLEGA